MVIVPIKLPIEYQSLGKDLRERQFTSANGKFQGFFWGGGTKTYDIIAWPLGSLLEKKKGAS